jgi:hypothetical protein
LIADVLFAQGYHVVHIRDAEHAEPHRLASPAHLVDGVLSYTTPDETQANLSLFAE